MLIPFGNIDDMELIKPPAPGIPMSPGKWMVRNTFTNGGAFLKTSKGSHATRDLLWNNLTIREYATMMKFVERGEPIVWHDFFAAKANALSQIFANPGIGGRSPIRNGYGTYENEQITIDVHENSQRRSQYIVVPEGFTLHFKASGSGTPRYGRRTAGTTTAFTAMNWNTAYTLSQGLYEIQVVGNGSVTLGKAMAQVLPSWETPELDNYLPGMGATQYRIDPSSVAGIGQSSVLDYMSLGFSLVESD